MLIITKLINIANSLDSKGLYIEADKIDDIIKSAIEEEPNILLNEFLNYFGKIPESIEELAKLKENANDYGKELAEAYWDKLIGSQMPKYEKGPTHKAPSHPATWTWGRHYPDLGEKLVRKELSERSSPAKHQVELKTQLSEEDLERERPLEQARKERKRRIDQLL